ncbi:MAG: DeoR family transcriptional regulator [Candidatus Peribacteria bacterium]|jgi:DeoR/GlpR family transcriptional regulator of sugar metabolism|nr:DeoR family transcriptional regulator [Candidatus Peribacteria bacterium]
MNKAKRQKFILDLLKKQEFIKVSDVINDLKVSRITLYRDLKELVEQHKIKEVLK